MPFEETNFSEIGELDPTEVFALHPPFQMAFLSELTNLRSDSEPHFRNLHQWYFKIAKESGEKNL